MTLPDAPGHPGRGTHSLRASLVWLLLATALWGFGFVATARTLTDLHPLWSNALRFLLAAPLALLLFRRRVVLDAAHLKAAALASLLLVTAFTFQTWGLKYTSVGRSSLITGLYAVFTPLLAPLLGASVPRMLHLLGAGVALSGLSVVSGEPWSTADGGGGLNRGDVLTLISALFSAGHIHVVGRVAPGKDPLALNALQLVGAAAWSLLLAVVAGAPLPDSVGPQVWASLAYLVVFSSIVAFGFQMAAQQVVSPSTAATLFLLEAPFGVACGVLFMAEPLGASQLGGGALMLAGCLMSVRADAHGRPPPSQPDSRIPASRGDRDDHGTA